MDVGRPSLRAAPGRPSGAPSDALDVALALIRELGEEARNLSSAFEQVIEALGKADPDQGEISLRQSRVKDLMDANGAAIDDRLRELQQHLTNHAWLRAALGDTEIRLRNLWDRAFREWIGRERNLSAYNATQVELDRFIQETLYVTVPARADQNMQRGLRIGGALKFYDEFEDEGTKDQLEKVLKWMHAHAASVRGIVDVDRGVIYKASASGWRRAGTLGFVVLVAALGIAIAWHRTSWQLKPFLAPALASDRQLARAVGLALVGLLIHAVVTGWKETRRAAVDGTEAPSLGNWVLVLHVRYLAAAAAVLAVVVAAFVVAQAAAVDGNVDGITMIAVGYGADSIMDAIFPKALSLVTKRSEVVDSVFA